MKILFIRREEDSDNPWKCRGNVLVLAAQEYFK